MILLTAQGQDVDTLWRYDAAEKAGLENVWKIVHHLEDSLTLTETYVRGNRYKSEYTAVLRGCNVSVMSDTIDDSIDYRVIKDHEVKWLSNAHDCDSLLLITTSRVYISGELSQSIQTKQVGRYPACMCGTQTYYQGYLSRSEELISCEGAVVDNLHLKRKEWSADMKYYIEIYIESMPFAMPGQGSDNGSLVILKNAKGDILDMGHDVMYRDLEIEWHPERSYVSYARAHDLSFKGGHIDYWF